MQFAIIGYLGLGLVLFVVKLLAYRVLSVNFAVSGSISFPGDAKRINNIYIEPEK